MKKVVFELELSEWECAVIERMIASGDYDSPSAIMKKLWCDCIDDDNIFDFFYEMGEKYGVEFDSYF